MTGRRASRSLVRRLPRPDDDRGSLAMAMMAVLVGAMLGALILPMVISQNKSTRFDMTRVHSLHAAQTGIDIALGKIRSSAKPDAEGNVLGDTTTLPCYTKGKDAPLTGTANGTGNGTYSVTVDYWVARPTPSGTRMICAPPPFGTFDTTTQTVTPRYAVITSTGKDGTVDSGSRGRTVISTYVFQTDDTNIPGGQIRIAPNASGDQWCMDAGSAVPISGTNVVLQPCSGSTPRAAEQVFAYRGDLSIQLVSSVTADTPSGVCLDTRGTPAPTHAAGQNIVVETCDEVEPAKCPDIYKCSTWSQQWSIDDSSRLQGATTNRDNIDGFCITAATLSDGMQLKVGGCGSGNQVWIPSPNAGAGMSGPTNQQLVNFLQFATCLDVTGDRPSEGFLIMYPCKQNPNPAFIRNNQRFVPSETLGVAPTKVLLRAKTDDGTAYCLTTPTSPAVLVTVTRPCPASAADPSTARWTMYQTQADTNGNALSYAQKYTIVDDLGRCLVPGPEKYQELYAKVIVSECDGSRAQKWNANASLDAAKITNTRETPPAP